MAKEIKFNIKLKIDGKEQLVSATSTVENFAVPSTSPNRTYRKPTPFL